MCIYMSKIGLLSFYNYFTQHQWQLWSNYGLWPFLTDPDTPPLRYTQWPWYIGQKQTLRQRKYHSSIKWWKLKLYKYWLVPRSTLKNYAPKLCRLMLLGGRRPEGNIAQLRGIIFQCWSRLTVDICFVISLSKIRDRVCMPYRPIQTRNSHTFNYLET